MIGTNRLARYGVGVLGLVGLTVALWWAWLGRDTGYQVDPVTGATSGPYQVWQVVGCVLCLAVLATVGRDGTAGVGRGASA